MVYYPYLFLSSLELILSVLLESLEFAPGNDEVYWNMGALQSPVVKDSGDIAPKLPFKVSFVHKMGSGEETMYS